MRAFIQFAFVALLAATLGASRATAQSDQQTNGPSNGQASGSQPAQPVQPDQPAGAQESNGGNESGDANVIPAIVQPDLQAPNGAGAFGPTFELPPEHSYILPQFDFTSTTNTNGAYTTEPGKSQFAAIQYLLGGATIEKVGRENELSVNYLGGRSFSGNGDIYNSTTHLFSLKDKWLKGRWAGTVSDQLSYASDTYFGGGAGSPGFGIPGSNLQPGFNPTQSLVVGRIPILYNNALAEFDYQASQRGSYTLIAGYSLLHYYGSGLINNESFLGEAGYNYQLSPQNSFSVEYLFDALRFGGNTESINENVIQATYVRHIAQRWDIRIGAGPDISLIQGSAVPSDTFASWRLNASLTYHVERTSVGVTYTHMLTGGSGVFLGSETDSLMASVSRQLTQYWTASLNFGYSRNSSLGVNSSTSPTGTFNTVFGGGGISRQIGRDWKAYVSYQGTYQTSSLGVCTTPPCVTNFSNQQVIAGFGWHPHAIAIE